MRSNIHSKKAQNSDNFCIADCRKLNPYAGIIRTGSTGAFSGTVFAAIPPRQLNRTFITKHMKEAIFLRAAMSAFGLHTPCFARLLRQNGSIRRANCAPQSHFGPKHQHAVSSRPVKYANPQCESPRHKPLGRHGVPIVTKDLQSDMSRGRKMGERVPIFPKK